MTRSENINQHVRDLTAIADFFEEENSKEWTFSLKTKLWLLSGFSFKMTKIITSEFHNPQEFCDFMWVRSTFPGLY